MSVLVQSGNAGELKEFTSFIPYQEDSSTSYIYCNGYYKSYSEGLILPIKQEDINTINLLVANKKIAYLIYTGSVFLMENDKRITISWNNTFKLLLSSQIPTGYSVNLPYLSTQLAYATVTTESGGTSTSVYKTQSNV